MANNSSVLGQLEIYNNPDFQQLENILNTKYSDNFFNIAVNQVYINNKGSMLIPFAKCYSSETEDLNFVLEKIEILINTIEIIKNFAIKIYFDSYYYGIKLITYLVIDGKVNVEIKDVKIIDTLS